MTTRRSRAKVPSQAERLTRAETRRGKMAAARAAVKPGTRAEDARRGHARTMALPDLSELDLTAEQIAEETCTVAQAAELLGCTQQNVNQVINRRSLPAWRLDGTRRVMVDDMLDSQAGRAQAARLANERHRLAWLGYHTTEGACQGAGCEHWTHSEDPSAPSADDMTMTEPSQ